MKKLFSLILVIALASGIFGLLQPKPVSAATTVLNPVADTDTQSDVAAGTNATVNVSQWNNLFTKFSLSGM
ncbi:hypothetical protein [Paenibacillus sacheonensis]|uniref:Uncharacterized protein n=1 Tax=Paenibacillus sacheonensis TaxID=742054 RepID=A0A7X4YUP3_9BACL|nr:hypothetical protein [Paenibacillus sacheonensis]MBM7569491.1 hypothetical protein [Paenibacillus sacheonensis]NBC71919.1 hypothetical protein [Paenibacillus sacheonensis]